MNRLLITHCKLVTPLGRNALKGREMGNLLTVEDAFIYIEDGIIKVTGRMADVEALGLAGVCDALDAKGRVVLPGFVDSHTHLVFGGYRPDEFSWRLKGDTYMSIMERGGGIQSTVNATRVESAEQLLEKAKWFADRMIEMGVTTVEVKSGYGLDTATELKMLEVANALKQDYADRIGVAVTFLGAHAVPKEYAGRTAQYCDLIINEMLPLVKDKAEYFDIFTEKNVFEIEDSRRLLKAARDAGMKLKLHADEIVQLGGAELAAEMGAVSADHLLHVSDQGVRRMAEAGVVATLLPLTAFALKEPYAPARKMIDADGAVALATDLNPGSCFSGSIPLTIALACIYMQMSIEEVISALTINGAAAIGRADSIGSIESGKEANLVLLEFDNINMLPYYIGMNCVNTTIYKGHVIKK
ncbi:MAG: imidazolonepropionase [Muribaculaceae bacterium]|nr:imidazolonepropionase [Muribaculaceae bacterium]